MSWMRVWDPCYACLFCLDLVVWFLNYPFLLSTFLANTYIKERSLVESELLCKYLVIKKKHRNREKIGRVFAKDTFTFNWFLIKFSFFFPFYYVIPKHPYLLFRSFSVKSLYPNIWESWRHKHLYQHPNPCNIVAP